MQMLTYERQDRTRCFASAAIGALLLFLLSLWFHPVAAGADPRTCIQDAGKAVEAADAKVFARLVDVDAILEQALNCLGRFARDRQKAREFPPMLALLFTQAAQENVRTLLLNEARAFVLQGIASGAFAGRKPRHVGTQGLLAPLFADVSTGRKEVRHIGQARWDGSGWLVPFVLHDWGNGESYDVTGRVISVDGGLRLVSLANMDAVISAVLRGSDL
ncbi:MAG: hypothetical protein IJU37_02655 [Desulfovibrio sp.]|nr:hypothetical protein [Desulfovibrio sp.]